MKPIRASNKEKGMAIIITSILLFFTLGIVGLAIDGGLAYVVRGRLTAAVDAAALGAGRGINLGTDVASANAAATASATRFFNANFPPGFMGTNPALTTVTPTFTQLTTNGSPNGVLQVTVTGRVSAPTYFMKIFNVPAVSVSASGTANRRTLVMMMILDISGSMGTRNTSVGTIPTSLVNNASSCEAMVYSSIQFLNYFSPYDYIGVATFSSSGQVVYNPSTNYKNTGSTGAAQAIANLQCGGSTNTTPALELSYTAIQNIGLKLAMNEIVLFTDGVANTVNGSFPVRTQKDTRFTPAVGYTISPPPSNNLLLHSDPLDPLTYNPGLTGWPKTLPLSTSDYNTYTSTSQTIRDRFGWYLASKNGPYQPRWIQDVNAPANNYTNCINNNSSNELAYKCYNAALPSTNTSPGTISGSIARGSISNASIWNGTTYNQGTNTSLGTTNNYSYTYGARQGIQATVVGGSTGSPPSGFPTASDSTYTSQTIAYFPDTDSYGNSHRGFKDNWVFEVNSQCAPAGTPINGGNLCRFMGGDWTQSPYNTLGEKSNFFASGPYQGKLRPDFPNVFPVAAMNSATNSANKIRGNTDYNIRIDSIYLMGNEGVVDREFLQRVANVQYISPIVFDPVGTQSYANPAYNSAQQQGLFFATTDGSQLSVLFAQIAANLLRLSQ